MSMSNALTFPAANVIITSQHILRLILCSSGKRVIRGVSINRDFQGKEQIQRCQHKKGVIKKTKLLKLHPLKRVIF